MKILAIVLPEIKETIMTVRLERWLSAVEMGSIIKYFQQDGINVSFSCAAVEHSFLIKFSARLTFDDLDIAQQLGDLLTEMK